MTPYLLATRFEGEVRELPGAPHHPFIQWCHLLAGGGINDPDEEAWCSSFANAIAWLLKLPRTRSKRARSWLTVGAAVELRDALVGFDVVVLTRGNGPQPGPEVLRAQGHVGFFGGRTPETVIVIGGNQSNTVTRQEYPLSRVLGVRRLA